MQLVGIDFTQFIKENLACPMCKGNPLKIEETKLICPVCSRYYTIKEEICFMLPDHLRDDISLKERDNWICKTSYVKERITGLIDGRISSNPMSQAKRISIDTGLPFDTVYFFLLEEKYQRKNNNLIKSKLFQRYAESLKLVIENSTFSGGKLYDEKWMPYGSIPEAIERITAFEELSLEGGEEVLDIGSGTLRGAYYSFENGAKYYCGIDISPGMLKWGKYQVLERGFSNVDIVVADVRYIPFRAQTFDSVISLELIEHIAIEAEKVFRETFRILKPGGIAVLNTWNMSTHFLKRSKKNHGYFYNNYYYKFYYPKEYETLFADLGFSEKTVYGHRFILLHGFLKRLGFHKHLECGLAVERLTRKFPSLSLCWAHF